MTDPSTPCSCDSRDALEASGSGPGEVEVGGAARDAVSVVEFRVEDMDCASCLDTIRRGLEKRSGISRVDGSPVSRRLEVAYDPRELDPETIRREVSDLGYRVLVPSESDELAIRVWSSPRAYRTYVAGVLFFLGLALRLALHGTIVDSHGAPSWPGGEDLLFVVAALVGASNFLPRAVGALRARVLDMHVLMLLAVIGAAAIGEYMEAAAIAFLFSVAELLEGFAAERAEASVRSLMELSPDVARIRREGREVTVRAAEVAAGDLVVVRPGRAYPGGRRSRGRPFGRERGPHYGRGNAG